MDTKTDINTTQQGPISISQEAAVPQLEALTPFTYPLHIRIFLWSIALLATITITHFFIFERPIHRKLSRELRVADQMFNDQNYSEAIAKYNKIYEQYPDAKEIRIKLVQAYSALGALENSVDYCAKGLYIICEAADKKETRYTKDERESMKKYLPAEWHDCFESLFAEVKRK